MQVQLKHYCVIQRFETIKLDANFLKALTSTCIKYIDKFFVKTKEIKLFELIEWTNIKSRAIIIKCENDFIFTPCSELDEHD